MALGACNTVPSPTGRARDRVRGFWIARLPHPSELRVFFTAFRFGFGGLEA
jgi:hypothetical protein